MSGFFGCAHETTDSSFSAVDQVRQSDGQKDMYRCEATSLEGFVQQLAVSYVGNGYFFYVTGQIPEGKDAGAVDAKLIARYGVDVSKWSRARKKQAGLANVQYIRFGRFFVLLATHGAHRFFRDEAKAIRDARRVPIKVGGYAVSYRGGHAHVRIDRETYKDLKAHLIELGLHRTAEPLIQELDALPFERYAPVRRQLLNILRAVNRARKTAGFSRVGYECLRLCRRVVRPFGAARKGEGSLEPAVWQGEGGGHILCGTQSEQEASDGDTQGRDKEGAVHVMASGGHDRGPAEASARARQGVGG